ncbi:MAG: segregation/condensation protein A [Patescibacteria group bacterium]
MSDDEKKYDVNVDVFQGPLDLLLHLIENRKLHICDISLSQITDDYMSYLVQLKSFSIESSADFILTASILMLIKSKFLLPSLDLTREEEQNIEELEIRLKEYQIIKKLSAHIQNGFGKKVIFFRRQNKKREIVFSPDKNMKISKLCSAIKNVLKQLPKKILSPHTVVEKIISLEEVINNLSDRIKVSLNMSFKNFLGMKKENGVLSKEDKITVVVSFLAMLELVKQGAIIVKQKCQFGDIDMNTQQVETPNYL